MLLWRSDRLRKNAKDDSLDPKTKRGTRTHNGYMCISPLLRFLDLPSEALDVWLELHNRVAKDRLKLTVRKARGFETALVEGTKWGGLVSGERCLLRRLGLIGGKRKCLWLQVIYRKVEHP